MVARGQAGLAGLAEDLSLPDRVAHLDVDRTHVAVEREQAEVMIEDDGVAAEPEGQSEVSRVWWTVKLSTAPFCLNLLGDAAIRVGAAAAGSGHMRARQLSYLLISDNVS